MKNWECLINPAENCIDINFKGGGVDCYNDAGWSKENLTPRNALFIPKAVRAKAEAKWKRWESARNSLNCALDDIRSARRNLKFAEDQLFSFSEVKFGDVTRMLGDVEDDLEGFVVDP